MTGKTVTKEDLKRFYHTLLDQHHYSGEYRIEDWLRRFRYLQAQGRKRAKLAKMSIYLLVAIVVIGVVAVIQSWPIIPLMVGLLVLDIVFLIAMSKHQKLFDRLRQTLLPFLAVLQQDSHPDQPLSMELDLRGFDQVSKRVRHTAAGKQYPKVEESLFQDPWCQGQLTLCDNSVLSWQVQEIVRQRKIRKKNARGKIKFKTKYKCRTRLEFSLSFKHNRYQLNDGAAKLQVRQGERRTVLKSRQVLPITQQPGMPLPFRELLLGVSNLFKCLEPQG
ncbi:hypothetical protein [Gynuella sunshinyii]|uniref:Uncharacterized protein n=1 Tax=Gynuella sunshinyii YC6258 TaxID=1445510 RepID=A0A0C5VHH5_9GAMM|nr:hypothetical protein [Gynuella sunshinyii]AJQ92763.1 hypothetical Protein YC6258_00713 [Gynuella sunshinyii YC6258]